MDEPPSKRRRTSADPSDAPAPTPSPSRSRSKRPSFASPTKASLARHNPQILERRRSASPSKPESPAVARRTDRSLSEVRETQEAAIRQEDVAASELQKEHQDDGEVPQSDGSAPSSGRSLRMLRGGLAAAPRRSSAIPNPRPLPQPGPADEDELSPFVGRDTNTASKTGVPTSRPEPELPPSVPDPISSSSPRGIHSSPSRWRDKSRVKKSSPLKPAAERPTKDTAQRTNLFPRKGQGLHNVGDDAEQVDALLDQESHPARAVPKHDGNHERRKEIGTLQEEIAKLKHDLGVVHRENDRVRMMQNSGRILAPANEDAVMEVVRRHLIPKDDNVRPTQSQQLLNAALNPTALLPFGRPIRPAKELDLSDDFEKIRSHHPIAMTAEEELPYLQLFSPFQVVTDIAVLPNVPEQPLRQRHAISLRSRRSPGAFTARIEMVINAMNLTILELRVPSVHPAAKAELGPLIEKICSGDCNRSMQRNVGILSWAMGEWHRVSMDRAALWSRLEAEVGTKNGVRKCVEKLRVRKARRSQDDEDDDAQAPSATPLKRADLLRLVGQQKFSIPVYPVSGSGSSLPSTLQFTWKIGFDWTGEAQSSLGVDLAAPGKWHTKDKQGVLGQLPKLFDEIVESGDEPIEAVRTVVALMAGE